MAYTQKPKDRPNTCVIHCRVSTPKQKYQGESLDVQAGVCADIAAAHGWRLVHAPWQEGFSGRQEIRPVFEEILSFLDAHPGEVGYYLFRSIDRFTRAGSLSYEQMKREITKRGVEVVDSFGIIQPSRNTLEGLGFEYSWSRINPSAISEVVVASAAQSEVSNILTRLIGEEIRLTQLGYKIGAPRDGFVNGKMFVGGKRHTIEEPDPERAKYITAMFELRASGQYSDKEICTRVNAMGYRTKAHQRWNRNKTEVIGNTGNKPLTPKRLQEIVRRPIYCGIICGKWTKGKPVKAAYCGLVSVELFNAANRGKVFIRGSEEGFEILYDYKPVQAVSKRTRDNPMFPYRHVITCSHCGKPFLGSMSRGRSGERFPFYHCARQHKYLGIPKAAFELTLGDYLHDLRFQPEAARSTKRAFLECYHQRKQRFATFAKEVQSNVAELEAREATVLRAFPHATTGLVRQSLEEQATALHQEIAKARASTTNLDVTHDDVEGYLKDASEIIEHPHLLLETPVDITQMRARYTLVFHGLPTYAEIGNRTAKLRLFFRLVSASTDAEFKLVRLDDLQWNQLETEVLHWKGLSGLLNLTTHDGGDQDKCAA